MNPNALSSKWAQAAAFISVLFTSEAVCGLFSICGTSDRRLRAWMEVHVWTGIKERSAFQRSDVQTQHSELIIVTSWSPKLHSDWWKTLRTCWKVLLVVALFEFTPAETQPRNEEEKYTQACLHWAGDHSVHHKIHGLCSGLCYCFWSLASNTRSAAPVIITDCVYIH